MRGTVYKRALHSGGVMWEYQLDASRDESGKRLRFTKGGFKTKRDAAAELAYKLQEFMEGGRMVAPACTLSEHLQRWLDHAAAQRCGPKTLERYQELVQYLSQQILSVKLRDLSPFLLEREYKRLKEQGGHHRKTREPRPLSATTVRKIHGVIHAALNAAIRWKLLRANPAAGCVLPKIERKERKVLDLNQTEWFFDAARDSWILRLLEVAAATGCRRGELLALRWADVDLEASTIVISKSLSQTKAGVYVKPPKGGRNRLISLPASAVEVLRAHRAEQAEFRSKFGRDYRTDLDLVFAASDGGYRKPDSVSARACAIARRAAFAGVSLHSLRHSHGSQMMAAGVSLPVVSKRMGHSSPHVTAQVYLHPVGREETDAANVWESKMGSVLREGKDAEKAAN